MKIIGIGNTAEVLEYEEGKVCKLFHEGFWKPAIELEYNNAVLLQSMDLPTVKVYGMEQIGARTGIIYERLFGETILDKLVRGDGEAEQLMEQVATLHKRIISVHNEDSMSYKMFLTMITGDDTEEKRQLQKEIAKLPDGTNLCHGDFHPGNVWVNKDGSNVIIDFMNVCHGPWQYDVARSYVLMTYGELAEDMPNREKIASMRKQIAQLYLKKMGVTYDDIAMYISIIEACRGYEIHQE